MQKNRIASLKPGSIFLGRYRVIDELEEIAYGRAYEAELDEALTTAATISYNVAADGISQAAPPVESGTRSFRLEVLYDLIDQRDLKQVFDKFEKESHDSNLPSTVEVGITPDNIVFRITRL